MLKQGKETTIPCINEEYHNICLWSNQNGRCCHAMMYEKDVTMSLEDVCEKWFQPRKARPAGEKYA